MWILGTTLFILQSIWHAGVEFHLVLLLRLVVPIASWRAMCDRRLTAIGRRWVAVNTWIWKSLNGLTVETRLAPGVELARDKRYLMLPNHQSWVDTFGLHAVLLPATPFLTFFLKRELMFVPIFGSVWWGLGFPFMKRYSSAELARHPELKGKDLETTRAMCERMRGQPYAILNFVEGTRWTEKKAEKSPFKHLLPPKAGGIATALEALGYDFDYVLDVTMKYPDRIPTFMDLLTGRAGRLICQVDVIPLDTIPRGSYFEDEAHATRFREWLNGVWKQKDERLGAMR